MSLNLLPPTYQHKLAARALWRQWRLAAIALAIVSVLITASLLSQQRWFDRRLVQLDRQVTQLQQASTGPQSENITSITTALNGTIKELTQVVDAPRAWSYDLSLVMAIIPSAVTLQTVSLSSDGSLTLSGVAKTRASFIALDEALKKSPLLQSVTTTATPSRRENLPFTYTAVVAQPST